MKGETSHRDVRNEQVKQLELEIRGIVFSRMLVFLSGRANDGSCWDEKRHGAPHGGRHGVRRRGDTVAEWQTLIASGMPSRSLTAHWVKELRWTCRGLTILKW